MTSKKIKKYKMISIEYTLDCLKKPYCSFCYLKRERAFDSLSPKNIITRWSGKGGLFESYRELRKAITFRIENTEQIAIAYNGRWIGDLITLVEECRTKNPGVVINITTNPAFVTSQIVAVFQNIKIEMVALSLDFEKCDKQLKNWKKAAELLKTKSIKIGANILMLDSMFSKISQVLEEVNPYCQQIHLLRPKFYKTKISKAKRKRLLFMLKQIPRYRSKLYVDQCFRFELFGTPCTRGEDFAAVHPDGQVTPCSYELSKYPKKKLKKCPFI